MEFKLIDRYIFQLLFIKIKKPKIYRDISQIKVYYILIFFFKYNSLSPKKWHWVPKKVADRKLFWGTRSSVWRYFLKIAQLRLKCLKVNHLKIIAPSLSRHYWKPFIIKQLCTEVKMSAKKMRLIKLYVHYIFIFERLKYWVIN